MRKFTKGITKKISKPFKSSHDRVPSVSENADPQGASLSQKVEDTLHLHPSNNNQHSATSEIPSHSVNQGLPREPTLQAHALPDPKLVDAELQGARDGMQNMGLLGRHATSMASAAISAPAGLVAEDDFETTYLQPLKVIDVILEKVADVHPYAKMALGVLSIASKIILAQAQRDASIKGLLKKLAQVYGFMTQDDSLGKIESMRGIVGKIVQQILECARFIKGYSETQGFWKRLGKNVLSETDMIVKRYGDSFDGLMQQFRDQVDRDVAVFVQRTGDTLDLEDIAYAKGAGLNTMKQCLPGTRTEILSQITDWINGGEDATKRVLWLSGPAGTGKSAIAHTTAKWFSAMGVLGSCFCFDKTEKRHEKMRRALADAVKDSTSLKNSKDIFQQWEKLLMEPLKFSKSSVGPVLIVIEGLDESGGLETRRDLLRIISGKLQNKGLPKITELPPNFRILVTSRPVPDIEKEFENVDHILQLSMDDIPAQVVERDISAFVSEELKELSEFQDTHLAVLARKSDGLFEWARLACGYIKEPYFGLSPMDCFDAVVSRDPGERKDLLYDMYRLILEEITPKDKYTKAQYQKVIARFRSVMGQIFATAEPLPLASLQAMRQYFPDDHDHYEVDGAIKGMGALLSGTTHSDTPIRPLHATFQEFLMDESSSGDFFVERTKAQERDLALASLRVMKHDLRFNICDLKSSYLPNSQDTGLPQRLKTSISPHLSYSCRHWATHVKTTDFDNELAKEITSLFDDERLMFWVEALGLLNAISGAVTVLPLVAKWLKGHSEYEDLRRTTMDVQRFIQIFGGMILHSTPHLYLSALPFSPINSIMASKFTSRFPNNLRLAFGRDLNWTAVQTIINAHTDVVRSVALSPDGTRIASGSDDKTVRVWDAVTGRPLGEPLEGHTAAVYAVSFSPDGTRIASSSEDKTVRLWDIATGQPLGEPLQGHTADVNTVTFSPDGTRIASGSVDRTVRLWDVGTGKSLYEPLKGHIQTVQSISFSPDGTRIVSGSMDNTVRLWDAATGQPLGEPLEGHTAAVYAVSFSSDGTRIASGSSDNTVRLWNAATGQPSGEPLQGHADAVYSVSFSPDGTRIVSGSRDKTVQLWDTATGQQVGGPLDGHAEAVLSVSFSRDGSRIVSGSADYTVRLWGVETGQPLEPLQGHTGEICSVSFSPDGTRIASGSWDNTVRLWDLVTGQPLGEPLQGHTAPVYSVSFSPDGTRIASGSVDYSVRLWDVATGKPLGELLLGQGVVSVSFSPDGTRIASACLDNTVRLWDVATGQQLGEPLQGHTEAVWSVSFSPDGTRIASGSEDKTVRLWDATTGQQLGGPLEGHTERVMSVSFSPNGTRITSGSDDKTVRLWDVATGQSLGEPLQGHTDAIWSVSFSPDGTRIASSSLDKTVRLWDAATRQPLGEPLQGHTEGVLSVSFSPDGVCLVSGSEDKTIRLWSPVKVQSSPESRELDSSAFSLHQSTTPHIHESCIMPTNTLNNHLIRFSSSLAHALPNPTDLLALAPDHNSHSTPFVLRADGWMMGPSHRLLFWVPPTARHSFYNPWTSLVIPRGGAELDLSRMAHGAHWSRCRDASA